MKKILIVLILGMTIGCTADEYSEDKAAYRQCIEQEPNIDECVYSYVKYLPEHMQKELED